MIKKSLFVLFLFSFSLEAQFTSKDIDGSWLLIKEDMLNGDAFRGAFVDLMLSFKGGQNTVLETKSSKSFYDYKIKDSILIVSTGAVNVVAKYKIQKLTPYELILIEDLGKLPTSATYRQYFIKTEENLQDKMNKKYVYPTMRIGIDTTIQMSEYAYPSFGFLSNNFSDVQEAAYDYIERKFIKLSKAKKGIFRFSFVLNKFGEIEGLNISESTVPSYNDFLAEAVYASEKKWKPVIFENHLVNCVIKFEFNYDDQAASNKEEESIEMALKIKLDKYYDDGMEAFNTENYQLAVSNFSKLLEIRPLAHDVRAYRAASYLAQKKAGSACVDWVFLKRHGVAQSNALLQKYCN